MQNLISKDFKGPNGLSAVFCFRPDTADENTINATFRDDEYQFRKYQPAAGESMIDAGGYIGTTAILYALLYPETRVITIEPLPENLEILRKNIEVNNLSDRITVVEKALFLHSDYVVGIYYRDDSPVGVAHKFVGTTAKKYTESVGSRFYNAITITLARIFEENQIGNVRLLKMDIEASEYQALFGVPDDVLNRIQTITGEYHNPDQTQIKDPRTTLFRLVERMFIDKSVGPETQFIGSFLFERKNI